MPPRAERRHRRVLESPRGARRGPPVRSPPRSLIPWLRSPSAAQRLVDLHDRGQLIPRRRGQIDFRGEELAFGVEDVEVRSDPIGVSEVGKLERSPCRRDAGFTLRSDLTGLAVEYQG